MIKIKAGQKLAWISMQNKNGWSLGLAVGKHNVWLRNVRFNSPEEVKRAVEGKALGVVFVWKKGQHPKGK